MDLEERLAFGRAGALFVALFELGQRHAEPLREQLHGVLEADLLVQLEELENVAADVAAKVGANPSLHINTKLAEGVVEFQPCP